MRDMEKEKEKGKRVNLDFHGLEKPCFDVAAGA